jgi:hypothetical protein
MPKENSTGATIGFESEHWCAADALRSNMDARPTGAAKNLG